MTLDQVITEAKNVCGNFRENEILLKENRLLNSLSSRLSAGELHIAVIGQFNRGKSSFINRLLDREILPTSVLPLTSVPTLINYSDSSGCTIEFEEREDIIFDGDDREVSSILTRYVTEDKNPLNEEKVVSAEVHCRSSFLDHGTVIIDTPGFGSTHIHNTTATLSVLKDCDAAFFMLSADLPITQMELNFIKQIVPHVSRLFFIYNKCDLLSPDELIKTKDFISKTLLDKLKLSTKDRFYTVSAKEALTNPKASGIDEIKSNLISFLQREKYFSLSEALDRKLRDSLKRISNELINIKIETEDIAKDESDRVIALECDRLLVEKELSESLDAIGKLEIISDKYLLEQLKERENEITEYLNMKISQVVELSQFKDINRAIPAINQLCEELFFRFNISIEQKLNREIKTLLSPINRKCYTISSNGPIQVDLPKFKTTLFRNSDKSFSIFTSQDKRDGAIIGFFHSNSIEVVNRSMIIMIDLLRTETIKFIEKIKNEVSRFYSMKSIDINNQIDNFNRIIDNKNSKVATKLSVIDNEINRVGKLLNK